MSLSFNILNNAMLIQLLHDLRAGNLQRCKTLGLSEDDLQLLQTLPYSIMASLAHAAVPWVHVRIDVQTFRRIIAQGERDEQLERLINRAIRLGASSAIMYECFGLLNSESALRRRLLNVPVRKGRPQQLSEAQQHALWLRWRQLRPKEHSKDSLAHFEAMLLLAEEQQISVSHIWQQVALHGERQ